MIATCALALLGLALLYLGGEALVRGASTIALRTGISPLAVGLTVVAFGTSAPELVVSVDAALAGASDIAIGNVVGSNIANIALILGIATLIRPASIQAKVIRVDAPLMTGVSIAILAVLADGIISRSDGAGLGAGLIVYVGITTWFARRESAAVRREFADVPATTPIGPRAVLILVPTGLAVLVLGGHLLVTSAVSLATRLGIGEAVIGLTIVAVGTSFPELATSLVAAIRGEGDIAVGNVIGSNIFNALGILGVTAVIEPLRPGGITPVDLGVMVGTAVVLTLLLATRRRLGRVEGGLFVAGYVAYVAWLIGG